MSLVTGITLIVGCGDADIVDPLINTYLEARGKAALVEIAHHGGGGKHPQMSIWSAGYNYFESGPWPGDEALTLVGFIDCVLTAPWLSPESVTIVVQHDAWSELRTYSVGDQL
jgi:hypothetical protein